MPKRTDIQTILIIGSGPIVIGQACEFDYSGTQACKALKDEGYRIVLVNSNPATIMTDPEFADATYIEPLTVDILEQIIQKERPHALLPTLGGQTALNLTMELAKEGILKRYNVELIGANIEAIEKGENRELFRKIMIEIGLGIAKSFVVHTLTEAQIAADAIGSYPLIIRPSFTLGGAGGGIAYNREEFEQIVRYGLEISPTHEVLVEESLLGWKEYEMEVIRDRKDQCIVVCAIENFDPMGVHTGDSITVAPTMTLSDKEYQFMRDASFAVIRAIGVETGGSNIQFAISPHTGDLKVIEMNPRVSRSSALASKATGFPIAKIAAKLAVGYTLDELQNDITQTTPASFEPTIDYVVTKIPRFTFEKFPGADTTLTSSMKSVGEVMAIGKTFKESFQKALRSLEIGVNGFGGGGKHGTLVVQDKDAIIKGLSRPWAERIFYIRYAFLANISLETIHSLTQIDPWFLKQLEQITQLEVHLSTFSINTLDADTLKQAKEYGFSDTQLAHLLGTKLRMVHKLRSDFGIHTCYCSVDTCAAEFEAKTPYYYSTYGQENELAISTKRKILIIGGGPNRIGQGIEFDYCCVHASFALREKGFETIMINSNPETVSTDYDVSDRLYFEPLTFEDILEVYKQEGCQGAIVQFGGQTPLNLAQSLEDNGVKIIGTLPRDIHRAEDRNLFNHLINKLGLKQPQSKIVYTPEEAFKEAGELGFPLLLRPSFVLGGRGMFIVYNLEELKKVVYESCSAAAGQPLLLDKFLEDATEVDVDAISDGTLTLVGGILEHIEYAGVHSGDAAMVLPAHTLSESMIAAIKSATYALAKELKVIGLMNIQFAIKDNTLYVLEVNPRASRTVPFVSKAIGVPLAKHAARIMAGETLAQIGFTQEITPKYFTVKESVFPFARFPGAFITLGPEMKSTGEVMGIDINLGIAFVKSQMAAQPKLPTEGNVFLSVKDADKPAAIDLAKELIALGFKLYSTTGTAAYLKQNAIEVETLFKLSQEARPNVNDFIKNGKIQLIINTPSGQIPHMDENLMRAEALQRNICMIITLSGALAAINGLKALKTQPVTVRSLQDYHTFN